MQKSSCLILAMPLLVGWLRSGPGLVGRTGLGVWVSDSFHIFSCAVMRSCFRDTQVKAWTFEVKAVGSEAEAWP